MVVQCCFATPPDEPVYADGLRTRRWSSGGGTGEEEEEDDDDEKRN